MQNNHQHCKRVNQYLPNIFLNKCKQTPEKTAKDILGYVYFAYDADGDELELGEYKFRYDKNGQQLCILEPAEQTVRDLYRWEQILGTNVYHKK